MTSRLAGSEPERDEGRRCREAGVGVGVALRHLLDGPGLDQVADERRVLISGTIGTTIEYFDFLLFGLIAPVVFNQLFFPQAAPLAGTIAVLATFAVGYVARPLGGLVFGHYGDRIGRKPIMFVTLVLMGGATTGIGLLPTYAAIGVAAPLLRCVQGFALGGETVGATIMATESAPHGKRGGYDSFFAELFRGAARRFSGLAVSRQVGGVIGGLFPLIAAALYAAAGSVWAVVGYYAAISVVSLGAVLAARETNREVLT